MIKKARHVTRVGKRNQVTIPAAMLHDVGLESGEQVEVRLGDDGEIHLSRPVDPWARFVGCLSRPGQKAYSDEELVELVKEARRARAAAAEDQYFSLPGSLSSNAG
ncbi:MAG: AbrB/MazE/SpoVT family DNA-binding domain-containing protein [Thermoflexaceae bacterium]|nr:AbrB/MazE/SpoVT family DNA-binding domain-containing protein [Thermoflexaceae bacterium]